MVHHDVIMRATELKLRAYLVCQTVSAGSIPVLEGGGGGVGALLFGLTGLGSVLVSIGRRMVGLFEWAGTVLSKNRSG